MQADPLTQLMIGQMLNSEFLYGALYIEGQQTDLSRVVSRCVWQTTSNEVRVANSRYFVDIAPVNAFIKHATLTNKHTPQFSLFDSQMI